MLQENRLLHVDRSSWNNTMDMALDKKRCPGELVDFPESPLSNLVMVLSNVQEVRQC